MSLQTPLARVRGLGSAKQGSHHWGLQRLTAVALVPLSLWFVVSIIAMIGADHDTVTVWLRSPLIAALMISLIGATFYHAQLGMQVVIEDYVHHEGIKLTLLIGIQFSLIAMGLAAIIAVLRVALGG